jgi:hypothetical protein
MVRPKASHRNLAIAVAFSKILTVDMQGQKNSARPTWVFCQGERSLHAAFASTLPKLSRDGLEKRPSNRRGVSVIEMNKALSSIGIQVVRTQKRPKRGPQDEKQATMKTPCAPRVKVSKNIEFLHIGCQP